MRLDTLRGRGAYKCACGVAVTLTLPDNRSCAGRRGPERCRSVLMAGLPVDLCAEHAAELRQHWRMEGQPSDEALAQAAKVRQQVAASRCPLVYYVRFADRIKIGWTIDIRQRLHDLPHDSLLALEPGGPDVERERHGQFAALHITGEWFRAAEPLLSHAAALGCDWMTADAAALQEAELPETALLTAPEAAAILGIPIQTIHQWVRRGFLSRAGVSPEGRPVYAYGDLLRAIPKGSKYRYRVPAWRSC